MTLFYVIGICLLGEVAPSYFRPNVKYIKGASGHSYTRLNEAKKITDIDVLLLGDSQAYRGFDPRIFKSSGIHMFNMGTSGQTPVQTQLLVSRYLQKINPKVIIFQVSPLMFSSLGVESSIDIFSNDTNDRLSIEMAYKINNIMTYNTLLFSVYENSMSGYSEYKEEKQKGEDLYINGGFVQKDISVQHRFNKLNTDFKLNKKQLKYFDEIIRLIKSKNIKIYFVQTPISKSLYNRVTVMDEFNSLVKSYGLYYNFNDILDLDDSYFYDENHLNQKGVEIFNNSLINSIKILN